MQYHAYKSKQRCLLHLTVSFDLMFYREQRAGTSRCVSLIPCLRSYQFTSTLWGTFDLGTQEDSLKNFLFKKRQSFYFIVIVDTLASHLLVNQDVRDATYFTKGIKMYSFWNWNRRGSAGFVDSREQSNWLDQLWAIQLNFHLIRKLLLR